MDCEFCGKSFQLVVGRGYNNRVTCYECTNQDKKKTYRNKHLKKKYGITQFQFTQLLDTQDSKCGVCDTELNSTCSPINHGQKRDPNDPCVDHCHKTGKVRGILCFHCNTALGHLFDDVNLLDKISKYLSN